VADLLAGAVSTGKSSDPAEGVLRNNMLSIYIAPQVYDAAGAIAREVSRFLAWMKASRPSRPATPVLLPGEIERRTRSARLAQGILLDGKTWEEFVAAAASVGIARAEVAAIVEAREA
jgi:hydroxycarboxylate dehydrogenase B